MIDGWEWGQSVTMSPIWARRAGLDNDCRRIVGNHANVGQNK